MADNAKRSIYKYTLTIKKYSIIVNRAVLWAEERDRELTEGETKPPTHPGTQSVWEMTFNRAHLTEHI